MKIAYSSDKHSHTNLPREFNLLGAVDIDKTTKP